MRTTIVLDEALLKEAAALTGMHSKHELTGLALREQCYSQRRTGNQLSGVTQRIIRAGVNFMKSAEQLQTFTYADYAQWPDEQRWELINGEAYAMTAPLRIHQTIVFELAGQIRNYLQGKPCQGYTAPFDVRLPRNDEMDNQVDTVVQPDISVICDASKLDKLGCRGAPDWIIEVSPSTVLRDMNIKRSLYEQHGVQEYWIIHPEDRWIMVYTLTELRRYGQSTVLGMDAPTVVQRFPDLCIDWSFMSA